MRQTVTELARKTSIQQACQTLAYPRSSYYRQQQVKPTVRQRKPTPSPRALPQPERDAVRETLNSERFVDSSPRQVYGTLLDEGQYLCSVSTMYRILKDNDEVRERRNQKRHPAYKKPELVATAPNQVWSWDITKLRGPVIHVYYYMYTILDIFSRYVVGYMIANRELARLARQLVADSCAKQEIEPDQLILHADRSSSMKSKSLALLLADLGVGKSHSRPYTSNDNPFSEAQFKTMKYRPDYPDRFGSLADARIWGRPFFHWYNNEHRHSNLGLMTPADVHYGRAGELTIQRQAVLQAAYEKYPERFVKGTPTSPKLPATVWINPPLESDGERPS
ncbi:MAG: IS3 family transposase [Chloroflexi bacterium]|nr:IS3 family transposase [Chloroflexota bacterium]